MRFDVITLFPDIIDKYMSISILKRAQIKNLIKVNTINLRDFGIGTYKQVDDKPFGGDKGMILMFEPILKAIQKIKQEYKSKKIKKYKIIATTAKGKIYKQSLVKSLKTNYDALIILCGRYEGFDQRILDKLVDCQISIGNFIVTGGELPALIIMDSITRIISGVLNNNSYTTDSFYKNENQIQYPQYTRPEIIEYQGKKFKVPKVLLSGHHKNIKKWQEQKSSKINNIK